ncbi:hypothetical protein VC83_01625 [Pseudogymnoascus destructans]|uniref:Copper-fist domain-containing protein n=2 Tax=Pseudogymnoascus destructans TaxID=655981 RepID=L8G4S6_PSED2|nr:uncharacterized protein VC83_01625 [Pseudogymnoascus destructans]ELR08097.1 hypothetical protein GMDG_02924 [Pseudogymnoascus destructans 20631-21]OAF61999.1 hypothetical protein VC83_01625 [Pseudogymnoascus destructans]
MLIAGEKFACDACVRGHRVSNCQHADRALQHIAKKGRPVSQCTHCRTLRKSRSAHVKCDCGEKIHTKAACTHGKEDSKDTCCCGHGGRCACALKKEYLEAVPESESDEGSIPESTEIRRPRAHTGQSDSTGLTVLANGHHKSSHKHTHMAHKKCGHPYVVPRPHPIQGSTSIGLANRSVDNLPHLSNVEALHGESHIKDSIVSARQEERKIKSEHGSPVTGPSSLEELNSQLPPLDLTNVESFPDFGFPISLDNYGLLQDIDQPIFSAGLSTTSIDWSHYDGLDFNNDSFAAPAFSQAASYTGFEFGSIEHPALTTTSTSGEISEVEDAGLYMDIGNNGMAQTAKHGSDYSETGENELYRLPTDSPYHSVRNQMLSTPVTSIDFDELLKNAAANSYLNTNHSLAMPFTDNKYLPSAFDAPFTLPADDDAAWMAPYMPNQGAHHPNVAEPHDHRVCDQ